MAQTAMDDTARVGILPLGSPHCTYFPTSIRRDGGLREGDADLTDLTRDRDYKQNVGTCNSSVAWKLEIGGRGRHQQL